MVKRALHLRSQERGATLFVVVLVLTLLTAVGLFSARSASLTDQASGYSRQASQISSMAELAVTAANAQLSSGAAGTLMGIAQNAANPYACDANRGVDPAIGPDCLIMASNEFAPLSGAPWVDTGNWRDMAPAFQVQLTDVEDLPVSPGAGAGAPRYVVTATAVAQVKPKGAADGCSEDKFMIASGQQVMRARFITGSP
jgi:Tfp pilus assembly protein PilX